MAFTMKVHERDRANPSVIVKTRPYIRLAERDAVPHFLQDGKFYTEDGKHVNQPPEWALKAAENLSDKAKKEVNYAGEPKKRGRPTKKVEDDGDSQSDGDVDLQGSA